MGKETGIEIKGKTLGIIGCGRIGKEVACLALGMGMFVIAFDPYKNDFFTPSENFQYAGMKDLLEKSDIISLHIPALKMEYPWLQNLLFGNEERTYIINTARGEL